MKIVCSKQNLINGVNIALKAVPANTTMSILNCILITAKEGYIKFTATDGDLGIDTKVEGVIAKEGIIAIEAKIFSEVVRKLPDMDVSIESDDNFVVKINCGKLNFEINGHDGSSFTLLPEIEKKNPITVSQLTLKDVIRQTIFSIGQSDTNKIMSGIHFFIKENVLKCSSLDGHRISIRNIELKNSYDTVEAIVPGKALGEISKILSGGADDDVEIYITKNHICFIFDDTTVVSRLIEGKFFDVNKMISSDYETKISINKKDLFESLDRTMLFSKEGNKKPIVVRISDGILKIEVNSPLGSMDEELDIKMQGREVNIGFNPRFLSDALRVIDDEVIDMYLVNAKAPCYIKDEKDSYIYLVLPINLNNI